MTNAAFIPGFWSNNNPFHEGEVTLQKKFGVHESVMQYAPKFLRPYMPGQHRDFYQGIPFLVVAARDKRGNMWASLLANELGTADFVTSPDDTTLDIHAEPVYGDALQDAFQEGDDLGILGIEFATKRRNRVNGRVTGRSEKDAAIRFSVDMSFGNCPQYIRPRKWWTTTPTCDRNNSERPAIQRHDRLTEEQMQQLRESDTMFLATGYRGEGENPRFGNDASHRGGPKGWILVKDDHTLVLPNFSGNDMYNSMGNLVLDNRMGVTVPLMETGGMIQLTGTTEMEFDERKAAAAFPGAKQLITFHIQEVVRVPDGALPLRWTLPANAAKTRRLVVTQKVKESQDVTSFHMRAYPGEDIQLWSFQPGQHLPIELRLGDNEKLERTYSLSGPPNFANNQQEYRISVKREPFGAASRFLHDRVDVGNVIRVNPPAGDFVLDQDDKDRTLVLLSAGVGVTPILSMLYGHVADGNPKTKALWIHGARDSQHHPMAGEVQDLKEEFPNEFDTHIVYSRPLPGDKFDASGRVDAKLVASLVPDLKKADFYMCGPGPFLADLQDGLEKLGVDPSRIQYETF